MGHLISETPSAAVRHRSGIRTPVLEAGEETVLEFLAPSTDLFECFCSMHSVTMQGYFQIEPPR